MGDSPGLSPMAVSLFSLLPNLSVNPVLELFTTQDISWAIHLASPQWLFLQLFPPPQSVRKSCT